MQNAPLPSVNASKAANLPKVNTNPGAGSSNDAFKQALSQQLEQRQTMKNAETRAAERQATTKTARQEQPIDHSAPPKPAEHARRAAGAGQKDAPKSANNDAKNDVNERAASDAEAAHAADPVADMLTLVAAFNQRTDASAASADADAALAGAGGAAASAVDAATLAVLTAAEAGTDTAEQLPDTEFQAALGSAADTLPAASSADAEALLTAGGADTDTPPAAGSADAASTPIPPRAELAGDAAPAKHAQGTSRPAVEAKTDASADTSAISATSATQHAPGTELPPKVEAGSFGQQLATVGARADAHAEADAALAAKEAASATPATLAAAGAAPGANALELAKVATPATTLYSRVGTPAWDQQLGQKVIFMAAGGEQSATMELNPPDLGPLQVVLSVNKDQATAAFTSAAPEVRQALEAALPRLREMMGEAGITLGNATVSSGAGQQAAGQRAGSSDGNRGGSGLGGAAGDDGAEVARTVTTRRLPSGAVDTFA